MRVVYTIAGLYRPAGMERIVSAKASALAELGYEVIIVTTEQKGRPNAFPLHPASGRGILPSVMKTTTGLLSCRKPSAIPPRCGATAGPFPPC